MVWRRTAAAVVAGCFVLAGAGCTSGASDPDASAATTRGTTTTRLGDLSATAQRWVDLREDNDCQGTRFGEAMDAVVGPEVFKDTADRTVTEEDWPEAKRRLLPVAAEYAATKQSMIDDVVAANWPPGAQEAIDDQIEVQRARVAWLQQIAAASTVEELNTVLAVALPMDRSPAVRAALDIAPWEEIHTSHFCQTR